MEMTACSSTPLPELSKTKGLLRRTGQGDDHGRHMDYIHYNPMKHGLVCCPQAWPNSSIAQGMRQGAYAADWMCLRDSGPARAVNFGDVEGRAGV